MPGLRRGYLRSRVALLATVLALVAGAVSACGGSDPQADGDPLRRPAGEIRFYGSDGNMLNSIGERLTDHPSGLAGMKGTAPFTRLSRTFKERLRGVDPGLKDELYAGESYDAVVISALAAEIAGTTDPKSVAAQINGVTVGGTVCESPARCLGLVRAGTNIAYKGISLQLGGFTDAGEPSAGTYGILRFTNQNRIDQNLTEFVPAGDPSTATKRPAPATGGENRDAPLKIGALLPRTGDLASSGPPLFAGAILGVREINAAGGVLGSPVVWVDGDDHTDPALAKGTAQRLIDEGVHVIIGAGASSITKAVLRTVVEAEVILFSPCNTAAELTQADDHGLYFRTAPPDGLQATALTDIIMRDGVRRLFIIARDDAYGTGLMESVHDELIQAGLTDTDVKAMTYSVDAKDFSEFGPAVKEFAPDGLLVIGFDESAELFSEIIKAGITSRVT